ncbi:DUF4145 domain-containing protein [Paenibacillus sp. ClWae2A]|uniref:DUF4145 domain-containing protein n=1 Tax=Paenibacillus sp. ClWae2A TaxID=3057177 RepID=UPI0028F58077|nr:DUF4145 domain-containing protein [Paenibacillus sp. ClWae2A]MDT9719644.1 DUF4145 domain-containing protein [Paenibacillus sp. ClWae2A]
MEKTEVMICYHCGNKTTMEHIAEAKKSEKETFNTFFGGGHDIEFFTFWNLYLCPVCDSVTLIKTTKNTEDVDIENLTLTPTTTVLYPDATVKEAGVPNNVRNSFEAALRIKNIEGTLCAIGIRRTLEMMCKDKEASGKTLFNKLEDLSEKGILPPIVAGMATVIRNLGNEAAHGDNREFSNEVIESIIKFTHVILDYVYNLPDELSRIQNELSQQSVEGSHSE